MEDADNDKIIITIPPSVDGFGLRRLIDYLKYLEATTNSKAKKSDIDKLADEVNSSWWEANKERLLSKSKRSKKI